MTLGASMESRLMALLSQPGYLPMKRHELARALRIRASERAELRALLRRLEREGRILCLRKNRWGLPNADRYISARLSALPSGGAIAAADGDPPREYFVGRAHLCGALHGDRVLIETIRRRGRGRETLDRMEARVVRVTERPNRRLAGLLLRNRYYWYVTPEHSRIQENIYVTGAREGIALVEGRHVVVELEPWSGPNEALRGEVVEDIGAENDPGLTIRILLRNHQLTAEFEPDVEAAARAARRDPSDEDLRGREDCRGLVTLTIDPEDARDFDDAVSIAPVDEGWEVGVHIADVSHFVPIGSAVDREAARRGNSVYLTGSFVPMLPPYLTSDVCSLKPHRDRLTYSVWITVDRDGRVLRHRVAPSVIHSRARLDYDQVQRHFDGRAHAAIPAEVRDPLEAMWGLARVLRARRIEAGALDLAMPEVRCVLDERGAPVSVERRGAPEAYHLIEEFMLLANVAVAERLAARRAPALYRIHEEPSPDQWEAMTTALGRLGIRRPMRDRSDINRVCAAAAGTPREHVVNLAVLRNLKRALYSDRLLPHFGLGFARYTHFTSPIRRYPDLIVHRLLKACEAKARTPYRYEDMRRIAAHCSQTERNADEAEEESLRHACIAYYAARLKAGDIGPHDALITDVMPRGVLVELVESLQRGLIPLHALGRDRFVAQPDEGVVRGRSSRRQYRIGDLIRVELIRVDERRQRIDFALAEEAASRPAGRRRHQRMR
jgi:ribonuclease R